MALIIVAELQKLNLKKEYNEQPKRKYCKKDHSNLRGILESIDYSVEPTVIRNQYNLCIQQGGGRLKLADLFVETYLNYNGNIIKLDITKDLSNEKNTRISFVYPSSKPKIYIPEMVEDD